MVKGNNTHCYLIEGHIEFRPEFNLLYSRLTNEEVVLYTPASRCLTLLIQNQGKVVTQQELFNAGWYDHGLAVTNSTFYQNVLMLRKAFKQVGCEHPIVKTIARQGLEIPAALDIQKSSSAYASPLTEGHEKVKEQTDVQPLLPVDVLSLPEKQIKASEKSKGSFLKEKRKAILTGISLLIGGILALSLTLQRQEDFFSNYKYIGSFDLCSVYIFNDRTTVEDFKKFILQNPISCSKGSVVYFTSFQFVPRVSLIHCGKKIISAKNNKCVSEYYLEWPKND